MILINYNVDEVGWRINFPDFKKYISKTVNETIEIMGIKVPQNISVSFFLTSDQKIKDLNMKYRKKNKNKTNWFDLAPNNWDLIDHFHEYREYTQQLKDLNIDKLHDVVYRHTGNDVNFMFYTNLAIRATQQLLDSTKTPYIFIAGCNAVCNINCVHDIDGLGFVEYCDAKQFEKGPHNHPLHEFSF